ncbi:MAG: galactosyl transferase [Parcubacteria group bacterium Gr01-1014_3]|nr:MAG: galactosyl transferase [Parcubacteria group bacterium Gr01-1014_3]
MKILYLVTKDDVGGAQKYVSDLADYMAKAGHEVSIIAGGKGGVRFLSNRLMPYILFVNDWLAIAEIALLFLKKKPDVIHLNSSKTGIVGTFGALLYNCLRKLTGQSTAKVIFTAHGWVFNPSNHLGTLRRKIYVLIHRLTSPFQNMIISVSEFDRALAIENKIAQENKLVTIHNGLDYNKLTFLDRSGARKTLVRLASLPQEILQNNDTWVGSIGRLVLEKNYLDFVEAAALVKNSQVRYFIIGSGEDFNKLTNRIIKLGLQNKFFLIPQLSPAANFLKAFDIFLLSSIKEGFPYSLLEAMSAELPVIATRVGGIPEMLATNNKETCGLVMPPKEPAELARAISYLIDNKEIAVDMGKKAALKARGELNIAQMGSKTLRVYSESR